MKVYLVLAALCMSIRNILGQGAGRAIPIATENFVVDLFRRVNSRIEYDSTNFLVDLSGNYANCNFINRRQHYTLIDEKTPEGGSIGVIQDYTRGAETHTNAVNSYLQPVFNTWVYGNDIDTSDFLSQIQSADKFGCSVRPGCGGQVSVACLFTPSNPGFIRPTPRPTPRPRTTPRPRPRTPPPTRRPTYPPPTTRRPLVGKQKAKAFTPQQYDMAEQITKQDWDNSYYLENLSGFETQCSMVTLKRWDFPYATEEAGLRGHNVIGLYGSEENRGSTPVALEKIMKDMKAEGLSNPSLRGFFNNRNQVQSKKVGCSLIPDCYVPGDPKMYVVVSCVFEI